MSNLGPHTINHLPILPCSSVLSVLVSSGTPFFRPYQPTPSLHSALNTPLYICRARPLHVLLLGLQIYAAPILVNPVRSRTGEALPRPTPALASRSRLLLAPATVRSPRYPLPLTPQSVLSGFTLHIQSLRVTGAHHTAPKSLLSVQRPAPGARHSTSPAPEGLLPRGASS